MGDAEDLAMLGRWRAGDSEAGTTLFRRHFDAVFSFFRAKLGSDVDELVQRTFLACVEAGERLDAVQSFRAYLFGIARFQLLRWLRERLRDDAIDPMSISALASVGTPSRQIAAAQGHELLLEALRALPLDLQIAVELFYWERLTMAEIGSVFGIPEGTVKSRLFRARTLLRERAVAFAGDSRRDPAGVAELDRWAEALRAAVGDAAPDDAGGDAPPESRG